MFRNRNQAGKVLAERLVAENLGRKVIILSLPRGGVVIGTILSSLLKFPHQVLIAKKITLPQDPELAIGAIATAKESLFLNQPLVNQLNISPQELSQAILVAQTKVNETRKELKMDSALNLVGKTVIITDDGAATGATMFAAIKEAKHLGAEEVVVALPVAPRETVEEFKKEAEKVMVVEQPELFFAVSQFYEDFPPVEWEEVKNLLKL